MKPINLTADRADIEQLYNSGKSQLEVAQIYGIAQATMSKEMRRMNIPVRPIGVSLGINWAGEKANIQRLYNDGKTQREIGKIYGARQTTISAQMARHGIKAGPKGRRVPGFNPVKPRQRKPKLHEPMTCFGGTTNCMVTGRLAAPVGKDIDINRVMMR